MGSRGPKPLPANVHLLRGNASKKPIGELVDSIQPPVEIPACPKFLLPAAKKEWRRITPLLYDLGLIAKIDRGTLAIYCAAVAWFEWHEQRLQEDIARVAAARAQWDADPANAGSAWSGGDGYMIPTANGNWQYNGHWVGKNKAAEQIDKFAANFGGAAAFRARVTPSDNYPFLPGMEPQANETKESTASAPAKISSLADFAPKTT
jgi:phage terminase small subunit